MLRRCCVRLSIISFVLAGIGVGAQTVSVPTDVVLYTSDVTTTAGNWAKVADGSAAGGQLMSSTDLGWSSLAAPLASPADYFEAPFTAQAGTSYHVWLRLRATNDSKFNDSVWVQFSDATDAGGGAVYGIGTTSGLLVNLERCFLCGDAGWGWQDKAYWLFQSPFVMFAATGTHTIRVQTREDGVQVDQIVLSPVTYLANPPGPPVNDSTIVPKSGSTPPPPSPTPFFGAPQAIPGTIAAATFDNGGEGVSYHDTTPGNTGGAFRSTDVDIEPSAEGGYDVGWIAPGEWLNYSVTVASAGTYTAQLRVASPSGGSLHIGFNGPSPVWTTVSIPGTGGWQTWTTVSVPVTLGAGQQLMTLFFDSFGFNVRSISVGSSVPPPSDSLSTVTWNIEVTNHFSDAYARQAMDLLLSANPRPQIITIQEGWQAFYATYLDELQRQTGITWYGVFQTHCPPGAWNGSSCTRAWDQGVGIFSPYPIVNSDMRFFPFADCWTSARAGLRAALNVNGRIVQVFTTHLQTGGCTADAQARYNSMSMLRQWASTYSTPQLLSGDFNADPDQIDSPQGLGGAFMDAWQAVNPGRALTAFGPNPTMQLDYWFSDPSGRAQAVAAEVLYGITTSDHYPVRATFALR